MQYYKVTLLYGEGKNCRFILEDENPKMALFHVMEFKEVQEINKEYKLTDFKVEELGDLPVPPKDRFWIERRDDGVYVILDDERRMAATFLFGEYYKTVQLTNYKGEEIPPSLNKTDFLLDVEIWLQTYYPAMVGSKPGEEEGQDE